MDTNNQFLSAIGRVRRAMPRNPDVMLICDTAEKLFRASFSTPPLAQLPDGDIRGPQAKRFDKKAYQRELMRKRRKEGKA